MASDKIASTATKISGSKSFKALGKVFKFFFIFIFLIIPIIYGVIISIEQHDFTVGAKYVGERFFSPVMEMQESAQQIIEQKGIYPKTGSPPRNLLEFFILYWNLLGSIYVIWRWIWLFSKLWGGSPMSDTSNIFRNNLAGVGIYFIGQLFYLTLTSVPEGLTRTEYILLPFTSFKTLGVALIIAIKGAMGIIDPTTIKPIINNTLIQNTTNITNSTQIVEQTVVGFA